MSKDGNGTGVHAGAYPHAQVGSGLELNTSVVSHYHYYYYYDYYCYFLLLLPLANYYDCL